MALILFSMIFLTLAGVGAVVALVAGFTTLLPIVAFAVAGAVVSIPVSLIIARHLGGRRRAVLT